MKYKRERKKESNNEMGERNDKNENKGKGDHGAVSLDANQVTFYLI